MEKFCFPSWHDLFKKNTFKSSVIPLPDTFIEYLESDGIFLPPDLDGQEYTPYHRAHDSDYDDDPADDDNNDTDDHENNQFTHHPDIINLAQQIQLAIRDLRSPAVFPKLDLSAPRDAAWMMTSGNLKCKNASDVFLLLKSSDFITYDLQRLKSEDPTHQFHLVLKEWTEIDPGMEVRCFVTNGELVAISQRDHLVFYEYLLALKSEIVSRVSTFWEKEVRGRFECDRFAFDLYLDARKVWIVDFNMLSEETDTYLFTLDEIDAVSCAERPVLRIHESREDAARYQTHAPKFTTNMMPHDALMMSQGTTLPEFAIKMYKELI